MLARRLVSCMIACAALWWLPPHANGARILPQSRRIGSHTASPYKARSGSETRQRNAVSEAVLRSLFAKYGPSHPAHQFFIQVRGRVTSDPSAGFMRRFEKNSPPVLPGSGVATGFQTRSRRTGKPGVLFWVGRITFEGDNRAQVECGYRATGRDGASLSCTLERKDGRWLAKSLVVKTQS